MLQPTRTVASDAAAASQVTDAQARLPLALESPRVACATCAARMRDQHDLVLLVGPVALMEAGGRGESEASGHRGEGGGGGRSRLGARPCQAREERVLSDEHRWSFFTPMASLDSDLHSLSRRLIELRIEHADLDASIDRLGEARPQDELLLRRLKKRRLALRDEIQKTQQLLVPPEPA